MYPFVRLAKEIVLFRNAPALSMLETHMSHHICWPWDLDMFLELNNGRTLTLYDLGRIILARRTGLWSAMGPRRWGLAVAGASVRFRKRVHVFQKVEMRTRCIGWDDKFFYMEQSMWRAGNCTSHLLVRAAVTDAKGLVRMDRVHRDSGLFGLSPELPQWVHLWDASERHRPWPPMQERPDVALPAA